MNRTTISAALAVLMLAIGWLVGRSTTPTVVETRVDTVPPLELLDRIENMRITNEGLLARLRGIEDRPPTVIVRADTLISPPDTVYQFVRVGRRGNLSLALLGRRDTLYAPEIQRGVDVSDCDHGWAVQDGIVVCDRARLGHVWLGPSVAWDSGDVMGYGGVWWRPSYRSDWSAFVGMGWDARVRVEVRRGVRLF